LKNSDFFQFKLKLSLLLELGWGVVFPNKSSSEIVVEKYLIGRDLKKNNDLLQINTETAFWCFSPHPAQPFMCACPSAKMLILYNNQQII